MGAYKEWSKYIDTEDIDLYAYFGPIGHDGYDALCANIPKETRKNAVLLLGTYGGDPDAGYRVARALIHHYGENFRVLVRISAKALAHLYASAQVSFYSRTEASLAR